MSIKRFTTERILTIWNSKVGRMECKSRQKLKFAKNIRPAPKSSDVELPKNYIQK